PDSHTRPSGGEEHEVSGANEEPDVSGDITTQQRNAGPCGAAGPHDSRSSREGHAGEGANVPWTSPPSESRNVNPPAELDDNGTHEERHPEPGEGPGQDLGSFKKPVAPGRPGGREKTLEPGNQPAPPARPPVPAPDWEAAPDGAPGLPSDAYRAAPAIPYEEPPWSGRPQALYSLEVLKGGAILSTKNLSRASWTIFGRLPACHVSLEHPSVSRFHAVLQYRSATGSEPNQERGFYVYDLGSTHGTFVNKQRIPPKTYSRIRVGHVMKFGGSTRLFILQGPEEDQEEESELTVTQIKEARLHREILQKKMLGEDSDEDEPSEKDKKEQTGTGEESGCMWGMGDDAIEEENEENPIAMEFQEEREALYLKNPKKALQGFFDREGEELEFEYDEHGPGSWVCRVKLPADDSAGKQLVAEITHSGRKKDAANLCSLEACRMLEMRGLLRQEAVSRKRKSKKWEDEDFYDSDDDTFLDRTGVVEKKRLNRMKKAGKIEEKPDTLESLTVKLELVEKEMLEVAAKLRTSQTDMPQPSTQDSLDAFMTEIKAESSLDSVSRKKLHLQSLELKKEQQRLKSLIKIVQPTKLPELKTNPAAEDPKAKKLTLPLFGAMKGGSKFKLKTGTVGKPPPKRTDIPPSLLTMKDTDEPEEEEDEDEQMKVESPGEGHSEDRLTVADAAEHSMKTNPVPETRAARRAEEVQRASPEKQQEPPERSTNTRSLNGPKKPAVPADGIPKPAAERQKKMYGPSKPPQGVLGSQYPEDDPDYCVWTPPTGQSGDGKTHLNEKYGY
ncbi:PREDICTED: kanadaptin, partial [Nanorana parkeri]|uniref:kanadaptin n=1 Tax=Nanorana parkeri TaxID=125878 RepID=UPI000854CE81